MIPGLGGIFSKLTGGGLPGMDGGGPISSSATQSGLNLSSDDHSSFVGGSLNKSGSLPWWGWLIIAGVAGLFLWHFFKKIILWP